MAASLIVSSLLVELLLEELPPKSLKALGESFANGLAEGLQALGLVGEGAVRTPLATPRRLAVHLTQVRSQAPQRTVRVKLMPVSVALDASGQPTPALLKKLAALGTDESVVPSLERALDGKSEALFWSRELPGVMLAEGLQSALQETLVRLPVAKQMRYQLADGWDSVQFVRPAHGLVALHGATLVPVTALGLQAHTQTLGHRFEATCHPVVLREADSYVQQLLDDGAVVASFAERRAEIVRQLSEAAARAATPGARPVDDEALLDEVTALVERPQVLLCEFEPAFLAVPPECLILTMKANQKYFPLLDPQGALTHQFLVVSNIRPADASRVVQGNERVVRPRLADAKFFFDQDRKKTLADRVPGLDKVVYHAKLGTQGVRVGRVRRLAVWVAERMGADAALADRAALLAKADLLTDMVGEFPELQGVMGGYYARHDGEHEAVAHAIETQYLNRRDAADTDPSIHGVAQALLIADRVETLVGIWGIGLKPTGDKDPFALRRHALTLINAFETAGARASWQLELSALLNFAVTVFEPIALAPDTAAQVQAFVFERCFHQLAVHHDARSVDAVVSLQPPLHQTAQRLKAVLAFAELPEAPALAAANKRVSNILKKTAEAANGPTAVDGALLREPAEAALWQSLQRVAPAADQAFKAGDYTASLQALAALRTPVDAFFDTVMVNAEDPALRANRLGLLSVLHAAMNRVADLSKLAT
ncbi:MAG: glycine--tRNA ligase subunit beta [Pseudomonadota bacterium]